MSAVARWSYTWETASGEVYDLSAGDRGVRMSDAEGLPVSRHEADTLSVPGSPGVMAGESTIREVSGNFTVSCWPHDGLDAGEIEARFIDDSRDGGTMTVKGVSSRAAFLARPDFSSPPHQPPRFTNLTVTADLDRGLWDEHKDAEGTVRVENRGEAFLWPTVVWQAGGDLILPSNVVVHLPTVSGERRLHLDPVESLVVTDLSGEVDHDTWGSFQAWSEGVPVGEARTYTVPPGARLEWAEGYVRPWT